MIWTAPQWQDPVSMALPSLYGLTDYEFSGRERRREPSSRSAEASRWTAPAGCPPGAPSWELSKVREGVGSDPGEEANVKQSTAFSTLRAPASQKRQHQGEARTQSCRSMPRRRRCGRGSGAQSQRRGRTVPSAQPQFQPAPATALAARARSSEVVCTKTRRQRAPTAGQQTPSGVVCRAIATRKVGVETGTSGPATKNRYARSPTNSVAAPNRIRPLTGLSNAPRMSGRNSAASAASKLFRSARFGWLDGAA